MKTIMMMLMLLGVTSVQLKAQVYGVGDSVGDVELTEIYNSGMKKGRLSDFAGKPMIIHFWNLHCPVAMRAFVGLQQIEKMYGDRMMIVTVTRDKTSDVDAFFSSVPFAKELRSLFVVNDTLLRKFFPHRVQPHEVWIGADGRVKAISEDIYLTPAVAASFLEGEDFSLPLKSEPLDLNLNSSRPMVAEMYPKYDKYFEAYSFFGKGIPGVGSSATTPDKPVEGLMKLRATNTSIYGLYEMAYRMPDIHRSRILVKDAAKYVVPDRSMENTFCYDLLLRTERAEAAYDRMKEDLDRFFGMKSRMEKRKIRCLVLRSKGDTELYQSKTFKGKSYYTDSSVVIRNIPIDLFIEGKLYALPLMVINETGYSGRIDVILPLNYLEIDALAAALEKHGLRLAEEERELVVIVAE